LCQFDFARDMLEPLPGYNSEPGFTGKVLFMADLAKAYSLWDKFDIKGAFGVFQNISEKKDYMDMSARLGIKSVIKRAKDFLYEEKENPLSPAQAVDIFANATRRGEKEKKYDDAVARLYRVIETSAQISAARAGLYRVKNGRPDTSDIDVSMVPEKIRAEYASFSSDGRLAVGFYRTFRLLSEIGDPLGEMFSKEWENSIEKAVSHRNNSILAHGFVPVGEKTYTDMRAVAETFLREICPDFENVYANARFPEVDWFRHGDALSS
jgi:CRISPR-associated protein (TIGR02710 family)